MNRGQQKISAAVILWEITLRSNCMIRQLWIIFLLRMRILFLGHHFHVSPEDRTCTQVSFMLVFVVILDLQVKSRSRGMSTHRVTDTLVLLEQLLPVAVHPPLLLPMAGTKWTNLQNGPASQVFR